MSTKIREVIEELNLELKYRQKVYPKLIDQGKMSRERARKRYQVLLDTKNWLEGIYTKMRAKGHNKETDLKSSATDGALQMELNL